MITFGVLHEAPPSVVLEKYAGPTYAAACMRSSGLSVGEIEVSQTVYATPAWTGSAVVAFLSVKNWPLGYDTTVCVLVHVAPPSFDTVAVTALRLSVNSNESADAYAVPSGPKDTHGS